MRKALGRALAQPEPFARKSLKDQARGAARHSNVHEVVPASPVDATSLIPAGRLKALRAS